MRTVTRKLLSAAIFTVLMVLFSITQARSMPIEVAPGYNLELVASGVAFMPTSITFGPDGKLYVSSLIGQISTVTPSTGNVSLLLPPGVLSGTMGLAFRPGTSDLYISNNYLLPGGSPLNPDDLKSRISVLNIGGGPISTFADGIPSMFFEDLPVPVTGSQGINFDSAGNLYVAQGINDVSRRAGDPFNSAILKIDTSGNVSVFASGVRSPYDVVVGHENSSGVATALYAGDNGEGESCEGPECLPGQPSRQYYDELNKILYGKYYGWIDGSLPGTVSPLQSFDVNPPTASYPFDAWPVPTGIDIKHGLWGNSKDPLFLDFFNCPSMFVPDLGTLEMFTGWHYGSRQTLARYIDGAIDLKMGPDNRLYFAEFQTGDIYAISPVPEPATLILLGSGMAGLALFRKRLS